MTKTSKSTFVAIGVGQGDAFFLRRGDQTVLIDGGRSSHGFSSQFQRVTGQDYVDILICTHNDADHAAGVLGFLQSELSCKKIWLPGSWTYRLKDILLNPEKFIGELISDIRKEEMNPRNRTSLQALGDQYPKEVAENNTDAGIDEGDLSSAFEEAMSPEDGRDLLWSHHLLWAFDNWLYSGHELWRMSRDHRRFGLFVEAITAAARIREIALATYHAGAKIRWFEYNNTSNKGGDPDFLVPLNAREISKVQYKRWSALNYLALTTANKQSLVFLSPEKGVEPPVLFTSDSDLTFSQDIHWKKGMIITAPHHGSENNANAYKRFAEETEDRQVSWVRSDGRFKKRPGHSYINSHGSRYCTTCRGSNHPKQDVRLIAKSNEWRPVSTEKCECRRV